MPHLHMHEIYTACAHVRFFDTVPLETPDSAYIQHDAILRFGWCPECVTHLLSDNCRKGRPRIEPRNVHVLRRYWSYKATAKMATAVPFQDIPYSAYDASGNSRQIPYTNAFFKSTLVWEEAAVLRAIDELAPKQVHLGPLLFTLPLDEETLRCLLRGARQWTILWAKGDDFLYKMDPGLDLNRVWNPIDDRGWEIERILLPYTPRS